MLNLKSVFKQKDSYVLTMSNFRDLANLPPEFHVPSLPNQNFKDENRFLAQYVQHSMKSHSIEHLL